MAKKTFKLPIYPANLGLDQSSIPGAANPASLIDCDNIIFSVNGSRKKKWGLNTYYRSGFTPTVSTSFRGMIDFWRNNSGVQQHKVIAFVGGKLWADNADGRFTEKTGTTTLNAEDRVVFDVFGGLLIATFQNSVPQYWTQTGNFADLDALRISNGKTIAIPAASICRVHGRRLWLSGVKTAPHRIYYSAADTPWSFDTADGGGSIDIDTGDSDPVGMTAIFPSYYDDLYVAKRRSLYRIRVLSSADLSTTDFKLEPIIKGIGCVEHNSVAATPNDIVWASDRGVHSLKNTNDYGDVNASFLSYPIHEQYQETVSFSKANNMWGVYHPEINSYLLAYTRRGNSTNVEILGYNVVLGQWFRWQDFDCAGLATYVDSRLKTRLLIGREDMNIGVIDSDEVTDFGNPITMYFTSPIVFPYNGRPDVEINFKRLWTFFKPQDAGEFSLSYKIDGKVTITKTVDMSGTGSALIGTSVIGQDIIGGTGEIKKVAIPLEGTGSGFQFTISQTPPDDDPGQDCEIYGYVIEGEYADDSAIATIS